MGHSCGVSENEPSSSCASAIPKVSGSPAGASDGGRMEVKGDEDVRMSQIRRGLVGLVKTTGYM